MCFNCSIIHHIAIMTLLDFFFLNKWIMSEKLANNHITKLYKFTTCYKTWQHCTKLYIITKYYKTWQHITNLYNITTYKNSATYYKTFRTLQHTTKPFQLYNTRQNFATLKHTTKLYNFIKQGRKWHFTAYIKCSIYTTKF